MQTAVLIPCLGADERTVSFARSLLDHPGVNVLVVDDGSPESYAATFSTLESIGCTVIRHEANLGKGVALRTGINALCTSEHQPGIIVTADGDGQHTIEDVLHAAELAHSHPDALVLGERDLTGADVPRRSVLGNRFISWMFSLLGGGDLPDTQTGLRAFSISLAPQLVALEGDRYEYEIRVLSWCCHEGIPFETYPISTIYQNGNEASHFRPLSDSMRVVAVLLSCAFRTRSHSTDKTTSEVQA